MNLTVQKITVTLKTYLNYIQKSNLKMFCSNLHNKILNYFTIHTNRIN